MIFKGSRYEKTPVYDVTDASGNTTKALAIRVVTPPAAGYTHTFTAGDRLDLMAYTFYRNPERSWLIGDANPDMDPADLERTGRQILIPPDRV